jgi:hydroxyacyl-ACP dehydratase HTD2-like protein with hotdog domain
MWYTVFVEQLRIIEISKKIRCFNGIRKFITMFTRARLSALLPVNILLFFVASVMLKNLVSSEIFCAKLGRLLGSLRWEVVNHAYSEDSQLFSISGSHSSVRNKKTPQVMLAKSTIYQVGNRLMTSSELNLSEAEETYAMQNVVKKPKISTKKMHPKLRIATVYFITIPFVFASYPWLCLANETSWDPSIKIL